MEEQTYVSKESGKLCRPFQSAADVICRGYSLRLQRVVTDFGADMAFARAVEKIEEHYGITLPVSAIAAITERHAQAITETGAMPAPRHTVAPLTLVAETDGSMIPIVETGSDAGVATDLRKTRKLLWKEARLSLVRRSDEVEPVFVVTLGDVATTGASLKKLAVAAGLNEKSRVHGLGDGAPWIAEQMECQFGAQGSYLVDFYHLCDYLAAAAKVCGNDCPDTWISFQKERLKTGQLSAVMEALSPFLEPDAIAAEDAPVRQCYRYIANRPGQFMYREALAANLPIGSGEVESAHRYVIQKRLKLPGAWWKKDNAQAMLNLRTARANHRWEHYWNAQAA